jgi:hypothetical protein
MTAPPGSRQLSLLPPSRSPLLSLDPNHRLVKLTELLDWVELEAIAQGVRRRKLKSRAGRRPHLRALVAAVVLMGTRKMTYREAEDQIRHYGPARYLCELTDSTWTPDFTTIQDFTELMGEDGLGELNEFVLRHAHGAGLLDLRTVSGDTTAQEAPMSYPTEVGLMGAFLGMVSKATKRAGKAMRQFGRGMAKQFDKGRRLLRHYRFFSKDKAERLATGHKLLKVVKGIKNKVDKALQKTKRGKAQLKKYSKVARQKLEHLCETMDRLAPQIQYWLDTGFVAKKKIINLLLPEVCSIPRGKVGKDVEFGLKWGVTRLGGGFLHGSVDPSRGNFNDKKHVVESVDDCIRLFEESPITYAYDRGGYSRQNLNKLRDLGVQEPGLVPAGSAPWPVNDKAQKKVRTARANVEGSIGALKSGRYTFNRPQVRSTHMLMTCGQRSILGYNLNRLLQLVAQRNEIALTGA